MKMCTCAAWVMRPVLALVVKTIVTCLLLEFVLAKDSMMDNSLVVNKQHKYEEGQEFTHLTVDKNTGTVYAGGINHLYQFDSDLNLLHDVTTGPVKDSFICSALGCEEDWMEVITTENVNKVLLIDYTKSRLIVCGVHKGLCQLRDLRNISVLYRNVSEPIAANTVTASTVAFIAPGPPSPKTTRVMYIGVTYTNNLAYRSEIPAISSRSLEDDNLFDFAFIGITTSTRMYVNSLARARYPITYVYGFESDNFSYFLTQQAKSTLFGAPFISKLVRVCQDDSDYISYTEIPIECNGTDGKHYNLAQAAYVGKPGKDLASQLDIQTNDDVLFAVFSPSEDSEFSTKPASESALCVYSMKSIQKMFFQNIRKCFSGIGDRGLDFISPSIRCHEIPNINLNEDFCGMHVNTPLGGELPVESVALLTFDVRLTAVVATTINVNTAVFLGTSQGHLKKVVIENQMKALEYGDIVVDEGSSVRQDINFDKAGDHLYVLTSNKISRVKVWECSIYNSCNECLGDPYCGWCSLENKCSVREDCHDAAQDTHHWNSYKTGICPTITEVKPDKLKRTAPVRMLSLKIDNMPSVDAALMCVFSARGKGLSTEAKRTAEGVSCNTPGTHFLPDILYNEHHLVMTLSVRKRGGPQFVFTNFTFFDCNTFSSCTECVSSPYPCDWCVDGHRCASDIAEECRNDIHVNGVSSLASSLRSGPSFCPRINAVESREIRVFSGTHKSIEVKVDNIAQFIMQNRFVCQVNIEGRVSSYNAQLLRDRIYCDLMEFSFSTDAPSTIATLAVIWGGSKPLDNPDNIHVLMYKCNAYSSCTECVSSPFPCDWCVDGHRCTHDTEVNCRNDLLINRIDKLGLDSSIRSGPSFCPRITSVESQEIRLSSGRNKSIEVKIENIPQFITQTRIVCQFNIDGSIKSVNARLQQDLLSCDHMDFSYTSLAPTTNAKLSVIWGESKSLDNPDNIHVLMYKCNVYSSCTECVSSPFPCDWCVESHRCTHDTALNCRNDVLINGINRIGPSIRNGPSFCPRITSVKNQEIRVPSGTNKSIKVKVDNIAQFISQTKFECQFNIEGRVTSVNAQLLRDTIYCDHMEFSYTSSAPSANVTFSVTWEGSKPLDNPDNIYVLVYKCHLMAYYSRKCRTLTERYNCSWCKSTSQCEDADQCPSPASLPSEGDTNVTISDHSVANVSIHNREIPDCNAYSSCTECVSSPYPCDWCVDGHRCTYDIAADCRNDILVTGVNRIGPSIRRGPSFCPRITVINSPEILASSGTTKSIKVKVDNIAQFITQTRFVCQFNIEGCVSSVNAQLLSDIMYCDTMEFSFTSVAPSINATFAVIWGGSKPLDNPDNIHVLVYKCDLMDPAFLLARNQTCPSINTPLGG